MKLIAKTCDIDTFKIDGLVIGVFEDEPLSGAAKSIDETLGGYLSRAISSKTFEPKPAQKLVVDSLGKHPAGKIVFAGLGKRSEISLDRVRKASGKAATALRDAGVKKFTTDLSHVEIEGVNVATVAQAAAEGSILALYRFEDFKSEKSKKVVDEIIFAASKAEVVEMDKGVQKGRVLAESACFSRDLINSPAKVVTPTYLANEAQKIAKKYKMRYMAMAPAEMEKLGMGGLLGVAAGSEQPPRFIIIENMKGPKSQKPIVLVGKGLTFDSGGLSLKTAEGMTEMKTDMSGGAAVLGTMRAIGELGMKVNVVGLIPATENMPGGSAIKPGDVLTTLSGLTIEVLNTDAEGRLVLSDALAYAKRYSPDCIVDLATLTGACMVALGSHAAGLFGNDDELMEQIRKAGEDTGERCWPMPLWPEYEELIKSDIADVKNIGPRWGGAITAAALLKKSVDGKWAHLDIAGVAHIDKPRAYIPKGAVGVGVRQLIRFIETRLGL